MENRVLSLFGGKATTELKYGKIDIGCNSDLHRAFAIVERFVIEKYYSKPKQIFSENNLFLEKLTDALVEKKLLTYYDISKIKEEIMCEVNNKF